MSNISFNREEAENIVRAIGLVFNNTKLYSPKHSVTKQALADCFTIVSTALQKAGELLLAVSDDSILLNGELVDSSNPLMSTVITTLGDIQVGSFGIKKEISKEKFYQLMDILNSDPEDLKAFGGFAEAIKAFDLSCVKATQVTVLQVTDEEEVIAKEDLASQMEGAADNIAKFLMDEAGSVEEIEGLAEQLKNVAANDTDKLGELIVSSSSEAKLAVEEGREDSYCDEVVDSIRRVYDAISSDPSFKTQKGKKALKKALKALEQSIVERLQDEGAYFSEEDFASLTDSFEQLNDEIEIDGLATEYMKKRNAIESNESRILRFIRAKGLDKITDSELREKLNTGGLSLEGWQELLFKSGIGDKLDEDGASGIAAVGHLALLLDKMETSVDLVDDKDLPQGKKTEVAEIMGDVDKEVQKMVLRAEKKIRDLVQQVNETDSEDEGKGAESSGKKKTAVISRKKLLERLAEVVQELCQPLSVINCSIEMILEGVLGEVSDPQTEMLTLADESTRKVQNLIDHLLELSGVPKTLKPDKKIQDSLYDKPEGGKA